MKDFSPFLHIRRYNNWAHKINSWKYLSEDLSFQLSPQRQSASFLLSTLNSLQGLLKVSSCSSTWLNPCRSRWQVPVCRCCSIAKLCPSHCDSHGLQHARLLCPSLSWRVCSNSCPLSQWCHSTISSSVASLLLLPSIFPSIRVFSLSRLFPSGD